MVTRSKIDQYVIDAVKEMREKNKISQNDLSFEMGFSESFVGHIENPNRRDKYNLKHINMLAKIFKCSPKDFLPNKPM